MRAHHNNSIIFWLLFVITAVAAAWFRFSWQNWDEGQLLHPDERFVIMVASQVRVPGSLGEYFDTQHSELNPHNKGFGFYVYGTLPLLILRFTSDLFNHDIPLEKIGRSISAGFDMLSCFLVFAIAAILFCRSAGLIAFFIYAFAVLPVQLAHYSAFDSAGAFFTTLVLFICVLIRSSSSAHFVLAVFAGCAAGMAGAAKINLLLVYILVPLAFFLSYFKSGLSTVITRVGILSFASALVLLISFRIFQPYAFIGPGLLDFYFNPRWLDNIRQLVSQTQAGLDFPPAVQWIDRSRLHGLLNMITWGFGLPTGVFLFFCFLFSVCCSIKSCLKSRADSPYLLPSFWALSGIAVYILAPIAQAVRYGLPCYAPLAVIGGAVSWQILNPAASWLFFRWNRFEIFVPRLIVVLALVSALLWAVAFTAIYRAEHPRIAASRWILQKIPSAISLAGYSDTNEHYMPITIPGDYRTIPLPVDAAFSVPYDFIASRIEAAVTPNAQQGQKYRLEISGNEISLDSEIEVSNGLIQGTFNPPLILKPGKTFRIRLTPHENYGTLLSRSALLRETDWDDGLPVRIDGFDPYGGIFYGKPTLDIYSKDHLMNSRRMAQVLADSDYFYISSNRQLGSVGRLPRQFPEAAVFYQKLLGCSAREYIPECYAEAQPGDRQGQLGYELIHTFSSYPALPGFSFNTQMADESFQVYDHPKVLIFKNSARLTLQELEKRLTVPVAR